MKKFVLSVIGAVLATVCATLITDWFKPSALGPFHEVVHRSSAPDPPAQLGQVSTDGHPRAPRSWCQSVKEQAASRRQHFGGIPQSLRDTFNENRCPEWGISLE